MNKKNETRGRKPKRDVEGFIKNLTREELEEIARVHIKQNENKHNKSSAVSDYHGLSLTKVAFILDLHRTSLYKKSKPRNYVYDQNQEFITKAFHENKMIYGRRKLAIYLEQKYNIIIDDRTLGRYLNRYGLITKTRVARRKREIKHMNVHYKDLVNRNYNPEQDNILATDVSYIPANEEQNFVYLSAVISHKTKLIESFEISKTNNVELVLQTFKKLKRKDFIIHSDHGFQYSHPVILNLLKHINGQVSMNGHKDPLDNREIEYFFGCLKSEYLNHINTSKMNIEEIKGHVNTYIT